MTDLVARAVLTGDASGLVGATTAGSAGLDQLAASATAAGTAGGAMAAPYDAASAAIAGQTAASTAAAAALSASGQAKLDEITRLTQLANASSATQGNISALSTAHAAYNSTVNQARALLAQGVITEAQYAASVEGASAKLALSRVMHDASSSAMNAEMSAAASLGAGLAAMGEEAEKGGIAIGTTTRYVRELFDEISSGRIRYLPSTIATLLNSGLGVSGGTLLMIGELAAVAAAIGLVIAATVSYENAIAGLDQAAAEQNNLLGLTSQQYQAEAQQIASTAEVSQRAGIKMVEALTTANIDPRAWNDLADAAEHMARATGTDVPTAMDKLKEAEKDPAKGAADFATQVGLLSAAQVELIQHMVEMGEKGDAQVQLAKDLKEAHGHAADNTSAWARAFGELATKASDAWTALGKFFGTSTDAETNPWVALAAAPAGPPPQSAAAARAAAEQARQNQLDQQLAGIRQEQDYGGHYAEIVKNEQDEVVLEKELAAGKITLAEYQQRMNTLDQEQLDLYDKKKTAAKSADDEDKKHLDTIKQLIEQGPKTVEEQQLHASWLEKEANASDGTAESIKNLKNQYDIAKAIEPYTRALELADDLHKKNKLSGDAYAKTLEKLNADIRAITTSMSNMAPAEDALAAKLQVHSGFGSLNSFYGSSGDAMAGIQQSADTIKTISAQIREQQVQDATTWMMDTLAAYKGSADGFAQYASEVQDIFNSKLAKAYTDDLARRKDWEAGVERGMQDLTKQTSDYAAQAQSFLQGFTQQAKNGFVQLAMGSKTVMANFFQWLQQELLKLAYQRFLAPMVDNLAGNITGMLGNMLNLGSGVAGALGQQLGSTPLNPMYVSIAGGPSGAFGLSGPLDGLSGDSGGFLSQIFGSGGFFSQLFNGGGFLSKLFGGGAGGGGIFSIFQDLFAFLGFHSGGVIGRDATMSIMAPASVFANAPRFHDGTYPWLQPGEVPIIAKEGEVISTAAQWQQVELALSRPVVIQMPSKGANDNAPPAFTINMNHAPGTTSKAGTPQQQPDGSWSIDIMVDQVDRTLAERSMRGKSAYTQSLENTHGLRRSPIG